MDHPIDFVFDPVVGFSGTADRMDLLPVSPNPTWRLAAILENFEWPYLWNELSAVAVLQGWHGVAEATPEKPHATPLATPNENMTFGT